MCIRDRGRAAAVGDRALIVPCEVNARQRVEITKISSNPPFALAFMLLNSICKCPKFKVLGVFHKRRATQKRYRMKDPEPCTDQNY